jgi:hypothetical protein
MRVLDDAGHRGDRGPWYQWPVFNLIRIAALFGLCSGAGGLACYDSPPASPAHPIPCNPALAPDKACPVGYACVANVCVTKTCRDVNDCPVGFVCGRAGCALVPDAGSRSVGTSPGPGTGITQTDAGVTP